MRNFSLIQGSATRRFQIVRRDAGSLENVARDVKGSSLHQFPSRFAPSKGWTEEKWADTRMLYRKGEFLKQTSDEELFDLASN